MWWLRNAIVFACWPGWPCAAIGKPSSIIAVAFGHIILLFTCGGIVVVIFEFSELRTFIYKRPRDEVVWKRRQI